MRWLLVATWVASALAATGAALAWSSVRGRDRLSRAVALGVGVLPFGLGAWIAGHWFHLRWSVGDTNALVLLGGVGLVAHALGLFALWRVARRSDWVPAPAPWTAGALVGAALTALLFGQLELRARLLAAHLRLEGGELARELLEPPPEPEHDAWPRYVELQSRLSESVDLDPWIADVRRLRAGEPIDHDSAALHEQLARVAPLLAEARSASRLADCDFVGRRANQARDWSSSSASPLPALELSGAWMLEGVVAARTGPMELALEDIEALLRLSAQAAGSPLLIDLLVAYAVRRDALELLAHALPAASASDLARLKSTWPAPLFPRAAAALDMEIAWGLSTFGLLGEGYSLVDEPGHWTSDVNTSLYLVFRFGQDVRGYRAAMESCRELAVGSLDELRRERESGAVALRARTQGVLALLAVPNIAPSLWGLRQGDARFELAGRALEALAADRATALAIGTWTDDDPAWGDDPPVFTLGGQR
jgi:hypothetical protein